MFRTALCGVIDGGRLVAKDAVGKVAALGRVGIDRRKRKPLELPHHVFRLCGVVACRAQAENRLQLPALLWPMVPSVKNGPCEP